MPAGAPYAMGSNASIVATTTVVMTVITATAAGDAIVVGALNGTVTTTITGVTDSKGNTYNLLKSETSGTGVNEYVFAALNTTPLTTSDTITATSSVSSVAAKLVIAVGCPGILTAAAADIAVSAVSAGSASPSVASGALGQGDELLVAFVATLNAGGATAWNAPFTTRGDAHSGTTQWQSAASSVAWATASVTAGGTIVSAKWSAIVVSLKGTSKAGPLVSQNTGMF